MTLTSLKSSSPSLGWRIFFFFGFALLVAGGISMLFADLLWRRGWNVHSTILFSLFLLLLLLSSVGSMHGLYGFFLRHFVEDRRITDLKDFTSQDIAETSTAILFPIYNEDAAEVYERLRATYESLEKTGQLKHFDFFILSDSTQSENWLDEEFRWLELTKALNAFGKIFYRRRLWNEAKKSGNIRDFLNAVGNRYRYFIVFDADSLMTGKAVVSLVQLMETHPDVGLIQAPPALINAQSLFGRIHQFANRLYGPLFNAGLNYWTQGFGNYWGHNAIIRTVPFMQYCGLPKLPGKKPFGGQILSHDFVEAALMVKNQWRVWIAHDLDGSYEEGPQGLIESAQRDRRWCQGNLQHMLVLFSRGLRGISRLHLIFGIFSYLSGPLWLAFLLTFNAQHWLNQRAGLSDITVHAFTPFLNMSATQHALLIFGLCTLVLFLPKILALIEVATDAERRMKFGGTGRVLSSAFLEIIFSTLQAPLQMLWHTGFVITILFGHAVNWGTQKRQADGTSWLYALRQHWRHTLIGVIWGIVVWQMDIHIFWWFVPVLLGMVFSIPFSVLTSRSTLGEAAREMGLFLTPEETQPPGEIAKLRSALNDLTAHESVKRTLPEIIMSPYLNAFHLSLLLIHGAERSNEAFARLRQGLPDLESLREKLLQEGVESLAAKEKLLVLSDEESVQWLHREIWLRPLHSLGESWQKRFQLLRIASIDAPTI